MSKVASALLSGKYSSPPPSADTPPEVDGDATAIAKAGDSDKGNKHDDIDDMVWVAPRMLKHLVGQGHADFSSGRQQDAAEYMQHLLEVSSNVCRLLRALFNPFRTARIFFFINYLELVRDTYCSGKKDEGRPVVIVVVHAFSCPGFCAGLSSLAHALFICFYLVAIPSHPIPSHPTPLHPIPSRPIPPHPHPHHPIPSIAADNAPL